MALIITPVGRVVTMVKSLLLMTSVANIFILVSSTATAYSSSSAAAASSSSNSNAAQSTSSSESAAQSAPCKPTVTATCKPPTVCRKNEIWSDCSVTVCRPKTCKDLGFPVPCPDLSSDGKCPVKPGCICREGYVKNQAGICIPMKRCPSCGGDPNAVSSGTGCGDNNCNRLCSNYNKKPGPCTLICLYNSCNCKPGFVFDEIKKRCVTPSQCTTVCKGKNEIFDLCPAPCPPQDCDVDPAVILCAVPPQPGDPKCKPDCRCIDDYVRNYKGECIPRDQCPPKCGANEVFNECVQGDCSPKNCSQIGFPIACPRIDPKYCEKGCLCKENYARNNEGVCIPVDQCPPVCKKNEVYSDCVNKPCPVQNCSLINVTVVCVKKDPKDCIEGCICKKAYMREDNGVCVPIAQCKSKCNKPNEYYEPCDYNCPPNTCESLDRAYACPIREGNTCKGRCKCKKGYFKNKIEECITEEQCRRCMGPHEYYSCGGACDNVCSTLNKQNQTNCPKVNVKCNEMCYCENDYARAKNGTCIPKKDCKKLQCKINQRYEKCPAWLCEPKKCSDLGDPIPCPDIPAGAKCPVKPACVCIDGYVKNKKGKCIPKENCPEFCSGENEVFENCKNPSCRPKKCSDLRCPLNCTDPPTCNKGCICKEGYVRNCKGICILIEQCPEFCSGKNEIFEDCTNPSCRPKKCCELGFPLNCTDPPNCNKGCICKEGYVRNCKGICIPIKQCPSCGGDKNAESGCGVNCLKKCYDLQSPDRPRPCPRICKENSCDCKEGYYYDENTNTCVSSEECTPTCKENEVYDKCQNGGCGYRNCSELDGPILCIDPIKCKGGCTCKKGYLRLDATGDCVPKKDCPKKCKKNEVYSECINGGCTAKNCSQIGLPIPCVKLDPKSCIEGCLCKEGYLRELNGECVPEKDCKPTCNKPNEYYKPCDYNCPPDTCESLDNAYACPIREGDTCKGRCKCKKGYFRNKIGQCITEEQCRRCMGPHEYYSCGGACDNVCSTLNKQNQTNCPKVNVKCNEMCYCENDYARAKNGTCIPKKDCKKLQCKINQRYEKCPAWLCEPKKCSDLGYPVPCPDIPAGGKCPVKPACVCIDGYVKNKKGKCIPKEDCPEFCSSDNEVFENCNNPSCLPQKCSELGFPLNCTDPSACNKGCICKEGYVRNCSGICIPIEQCPSCGGDKNAKSGCGFACSKKCYDLQYPDSPRPCLEICELNACQCKKGYYYDENTKTCVRSEECTPTCGNDEVFDPCINGGCTMKNCSQLGGPKICKDPKKCKPGCSCKKGYLRSDEGICIAIEKCPKAQCGKLEKFVMCPDALCQPLRCNQLGYPIPCPKTNKDCLEDCPGTPGCVCKDGYVRNARGKCIPKTDCPPTCKKNEVYDKCQNGGCGYRNCSELDGPLLCIDPIKCKGGCTCKEGYLRLDATGDCVPKEKCPKKCNKPNEVFVKCPPKCPPQNCKSLNQTYHCPLIKTKINESDCVGECRCIEGFYRNLIGECISKKDCLKCTGDHEYFSCGPECDNVCCDLDTQSKNNCPIINKKCTQKCYCEDGYARDYDGNCVCICQCPGITTTSKPAVNSTVALANFKRGNTILAIKFLNVMLSSRPGENFMFSTLSILIVLAQLALNAIGVALKELLQLLNFKDKAEIPIVFPILIDSFKDQKDVTFKLSNKYYVNDNFPLTKKFQCDAVNIFDSGAENIDFNQPEQAATTINDWVANRTNNLIKDLVSADMFNSQTRIAVFNCLYFLGNWLYQFDPKNTKPKDFYLNENDIVSLLTMYQQKRFEYAESDELDAQFLRVPYKNDKFSLFICLPNSKTGLKSMVEKLDADIFTEILNSLKYEDVKFSMPRMDFSTDISDLIELLKKCGVMAPFKDNDEFRGIFVKEMPLYISDAIQKSVYKADETGTEAAIATGAILSTRSQPLPSTVYTFNANRPFIFFLKYLDTILFCGAFVK